MVFCGEAGSSRLRGALVRRSAGRSIDQREVEGVFCSIVYRYNGR